MCLDWMWLYIDFLQLDFKRNYFRKSDHGTSISLKIDLIKVAYFKIYIIFHYIKEYYPLKNIKNCQQNRPTQTSWTNK